MGYIAYAKKLVRRLNRKYPFEIRFYCDNGEWVLEINGNKTHTAHGIDFYAGLETLEELELFGSIGLLKEKTKGETA